jgi:hypothetical protein
VDLIKSGDLAPRPENQKKKKKKKSQTNHDKKPPERGKLNILNSSNQPA